MAKTKAKRLQTSNWKLIREYVLSRAGNKCELCGSTEVLQCDHLISRRHKIIFYEPDNLSCLCRECHAKKSFNAQGREAHLVNIKAIERIGMDRYMELLRISRETLPTWSTVYYQEQKEMYLKALLAEQRSECS